MTVEVTGRHSWPRSRGRTRVQKLLAPDLASRGHVVALVAFDAVLILGVAGILKLTSLALHLMALGPDDLSVLRFLHEAQSTTIGVLVLLIAVKDVRAAIASSRGRGDSK